MSTRREFILLAAAASAGCVTRGTKSSASSAAPIVRAPAVGQNWRYAKHDYFTKKVVDTQIDRITKVATFIEIESHSETGEERSIKSEIHRPWGMVVVDPHWSDVQSFEQAIPLWPADLRPGWSTSVRTYYKIPGSEEAMPWQVTMEAQRWESVTVPAGRFIALRYYNFIDFRFSIFAERTAAHRKEHLWFAPEIGRWVIRESMGTFREQVVTEVNESSYRWELLSWT